MRTWPIQVLTHGETVFASGPRFSIWHGGGGDAWTLRLSGVRPEDAGRYECQVNTDPKMSLGIVLQVQGKTETRSDRYGMHCGVA